jgi:hypothetical protein
MDRSCLIYSARCSPFTRESSPSWPAVAWVQIDEPVLALDLTEKAQLAFGLAYGNLVGDKTPNLLLASYFGGLGPNLPTVVRLPVAGLHIDLVRDPTQLGEVLASARSDLWLSLGLVDGRNVWRNDLRRSLALARQAEAARGNRQLMIAPSCSLLHVPVDLSQETGLEELRNWLAFAQQKLAEIQLWRAPWMRETVPFPLRSKTATGLHRLAGAARRYTIPTWQGALHPRLLTWSSAKAPFLSVA